MYRELTLKIETFYRLALKEVQKEPCYHPWAPLNNSSTYGIRTWIDPLDIIEVQDNFVDIGSCMEF